MDAKNVVKLIRSDLESLKGSGRTLLDADALLDYLRLVEDDVASGSEGIDAIALERLKTTNELHVARFRMTGEVNLEMFRSVLASGQAAMRASMVINGAGATALLAFIGHIVGNGVRGSDVHLIAFPMLCFTVGTLFAALGFGGTYVTQSLFSQDRDKSAHRSNLATVVVVVASYLAFAVGIWRSYLVLAGM